MNIKRIAIVGCAVALVGAMTATAFASTVNGNVFHFNKGQQTTLSGQRVTVSAEDKATFKAKMDADKIAHQAEITAATEKWKALTDAQKEEVYQVQRDEINANIAIVDKYLSLGLIDSARASEMKAKLTEKLTNLTSNENIPMLGQGYENHGMMDGRGEGHKPGTPAVTTTSAVQ